MHIYFDVDYTIIAPGSYVLRPGTRELFATLRAEGEFVYVWSGVGLRPEVIADFDLGSFVCGLFVKPVRDYTSAVQAMFDRGQIPALPDMVVDDHPEVVDALGGVAVRPYLAHGDDREMARVYDYVLELRRGLQSGSG